MRSLGSYTSTLRREEQREQIRTIRPDNLMCSQFQNKYIKLCPSNYHVDQCILDLLVKGIHKNELPEIFRILLVHSIDVGWSVIVTDNSERWQTY